MKTLRICAAGHKYYKSSDCPVCPICAAEQKPAKGFLSNLAAPARRALENKGIDSLEKLALYSEQDIQSLHGIGKSSIPKLRYALEVQGLNFRSD